MFKFFFLIFKKLLQKLKKKIQISSKISVFCQVISAAFCLFRGVLFDVDSCPTTFYCFLFYLTFFLLLFFLFISMYSLFGVWLQVFWTSLNTNAVSKNTSQPSNMLSVAELFARYCDSILKKSATAVSGGALEAILGRVGKVLRYLEDREGFQKQHRLLLSKRLLFGLTWGPEYEYSLLTKIKVKKTDYNLFCEFEIVEKFFFRVVIV